MAEDLGERTELPTGRRLSEARNRGQVAKSADLAAVLDLASAFILVLILGGGLCAALAGMTRALLDARVTGPGTAIAQIDAAVRWAGANAALIALPFFGVLLLVSIAGQAAQVGWLFTLEPIRPKLDRLSPLAGIKRLFALRTLVKSLINLAKLAVVLAVVAAIIWGDRHRIAALPSLDLGQALILVGRMIWELLLWLLAIFAVIAAADFVYQRWQHTRDLRMTRQEVKEERRSMEGDPETKGRRLRLAREIAAAHIRREVPTADAVITNPTHVSVAIRYRADSMAAPVVVAKGADFLAFRIREVAAAHGVPIIERPPLARALYAQVDVGRPIPTELYQAVAEILAYVYRLEGKQTVNA